MDNGSRIEARNFLIIRENAFPNMAKDGAAIVDKVIRFIPGAAISEENDQWIIPLR